MSPAIKEAHLAQLKLRYPDATRQTLASGSSLITIPSVLLPTGWNAASTSVRFMEQPQYPFAAPDCFWGDELLRLANGQNPQSSGTQMIPETQLNGLWFSWHVGNKWNPNTDNYLTWMGCIGERLRRPQ